MPERGRVSERAGEAQSDCVNSAMRAYRKPDGSNQGGASRSSSLEGLLQQAWLQSQSRPKVPRRSVCDPLTDLSAEKRASSQSFAQLMSRADSGGAGDAEGLEKTYFHKTRPEEVPEFLRRRAPPRLESYSKKTELPRSCSTFPPESRSSAASVSDGVSQDSASSMFTSSDNLSNSTSGFLLNDTHACMDELFDVEDFEGLGSGSADLAAETEPLDRYFDEFLSNDNLDFEKCLMQLTTAYHATEKESGDLLVPYSAVDDACDPEAVDVERWSNAESLPIEEMYRSLEKTSAYQAMAKEIFSILPSEPEIVDAAESEVVDHEDSNRAEIFAPSEEVTALKIMEGFTCMLSKHIQDVSVSNSDTVDYRTWITESDKMEFDDAWKTYFEGWQHSFPTTSSLDSNLLHGGAGSNLSQASAGASTACTNMTELLYRCALAVSRGDTCSATECLEELRERSSPYGNSMERMAHYIREALVARMSGSGEQLYTVITNNHPTATSMFKSYRLYIDDCPYVKLKHFLTSKSILDAFEGASRVHVIHYGALFGTEWPSLLQHLSMRPGGPPHFRLTGVDIPYPGDDPLKKLHGMGRMLEKFAKQWGVPFEFHALAGSNWESFTARDINIKKDEALAVSSHRTHLTLDEGVLGASPRELLLRRIRSLNPKVFVLFVDNAACNAPLFMTRFRESVKHYSAVYDGLEIAMAPDAHERVIIEREVFGRELLNIVACEGQARIERAEPYQQWQNRMDRAGFILRPLNPTVFSKIKAMMASFHKDFGVGEDDGWLLMGIKDQITCASGVWEPKAAMNFH